MALDEANYRLLVVTRQPPRLMALDTDSGKMMASETTVGDADDLFFDSVHKRVYVTGGDGYLDVFAQLDPDHYRRITQIPTAGGARTSLFVPELDRLYVAVPHRGKQGAEIRVFEAVH
jgi:DNA-binding beta-propeller fold protein YncE